MKSIITLIVLLFTSTISFSKTVLTVNFTHDGLVLNGRLQLPNGPGPYQVIIVNPGTGANDKDGTLPMIGGNTPCLYPGLSGDTVRPYKGLSEALSDSGYAVLTYDKVEYTYPNPSPITFHKLWLPVESAIKYIKTRNDIDTNNIILLGHSEGSSMIPFIAKKQSSIKALISLAGPRRPLDSILAYQLLYIAKTCNGDTMLAKAQANQILQYFTDIRTGNWNSSTPAIFGVQPSVWDEYVKVVDSVSFNYNLANKRSLFIGLGDDINVPVSTELARFQTETTLDADFYSIPNLNHYITNTTNPATSEVLTDTIIYWLRKHIFPVSVQNMVQKKAMQLLFSVYPNPITHSCKIDVTDGYSHTATFSIVNIMGQELMQFCNIVLQPSKPYEINTSVLNTGTYFIRFQDNSGESQTIRIVKTCNP